MPIIDRYYYSALSSDESYVTRPTNYLSPPRLIAGKPAWKKPEGDTKKNEKNLGD